ncbi:plakophilin-1-like [Lampetra planeri]
MMLSTSSMSEGYLRTVTPSMGELHTSTLALPPERELERSMGGSRGQSDRVHQQVSMMMERSRGYNTVASLKNKSRAQRLQRTASQPEKFFAQTMNGGGTLSQASGSMSFAQTPTRNYSSRSQGYIFDTKISRPRTAGAGDGMRRAENGGDTYRRPGTASSAVDGYSSYGRRTLSVARPLVYEDVRLPGPPSLRLDVSPGEQPLPAPRVVLERQSVYGSQSASGLQSMNRRQATMSRVVTPTPAPPANGITTLGHYSMAGGGGGGYYEEYVVPQQPQPQYFKTMPNMGQQQQHHHHHHHQQSSTMSRSYQQQQQQQQQQQPQLPPPQLVQVQQAMPLRRPTTAPSYDQLDYAGADQAAEESRSGFGSSATASTTTRTTQVRQVQQQQQQQEQVRPPSPAQSTASQFSTMQHTSSGAEWGRTAQASFNTMLSQGMTLEKAVEMLRSKRDPQDLAYASAFIQSACYRNQANKDKVYTLMGIRELVELLQENRSAEVQSAACGALRNVIFEDKRNKLELRNVQGIPALAGMLGASKDKEVLRQATGALWNLSSCEELKQQLLHEVLDPLVERGVVPHSGVGNVANTLNSDPEIFYNATGCLRNLSSAGVEARKQMRECEGLVESLALFTDNAVTSGKLEERQARVGRTLGTVENCVCTLRNLSYQLGEEAPHRYADVLQEPPSYPTRSMAGPDGDTTGCFSGKSRRVPGPGGYRYDQYTLPMPNPKGMEWLWCPQLVKAYMGVLDKAKQPTLMEGAAGALQNITAGGSKAARSLGNVALMHGDGSATLADAMHRSTDGKTTKALAFLLRNLSRNPQNHAEMNAKLAPTLVGMLPGRVTSAQLDDEAVSSACYSIFDLVQANPAAAKRFQSLGTVRSLVSLVRDRAGAYPKSAEASSLLLHQFWEFKDLRKDYKRDGLKKDDFINNFTVRSVQNLYGRDSNSDRYQDGTLRY